MGNILKLLAKDDDDEQIEDVYLDFENASATDEEREIYEFVRQRCLSKAPEIIQDISTYQGAGNFIREAISRPWDERAQLRALHAILPNVKRIEKYYTFAKEIEAVAPVLLECLCGDELSAAEQLDRRQALAKQLALLLHFVLKFDDIKMCTPSIQNDFSYYRRILNTMRLNSNEAEEQMLQVNHDMANKMSLFYASATPMLKSLSEAVRRYVAERGDAELRKTTECITTMAKICRKMIENPNMRCRFHNEDTHMFTLRVMTGLIILYDNFHPVGAFVKNSPVDVKTSVKVLKRQPPDLAEGLLNALRYTTTHLNDENTPKQIKSLLL